MFIPEDKASFMGQIECGREFVHREINAFAQHCENERYFPHRLLLHYLNEMYPKSKPNNEGKERSRIQLQKG